MISTIKRPSQTLQRLCLRLSLSFGSLEDFPRVPQTKAFLLALSLTMFLLGCAQTPPRQANDDSAQQERVSDRYSREAVGSYEVFEIHIAEHVVMFVQLVTGERFPMICRRTVSGVYPIAQSVFAKSGAERWDIMCEPRVQNTYALVQLEVSRLDDVLFIDGRRLKPLAKVPLLSSPSR